MNMYGLHMIGSQLVHRTGEREFLWFYLASAVFAGICSLAFYTLLGTSTRVIGASGAVLAIYMMYAMLYPRQIFYFFGAFPIEARWLITILVAMDAIPLMMQLANRNLGTGVAHSAHLGGLLFGFCTSAGTCICPVVGSFCRPCEGTAENQPRQTEGL